MAGASISMCPSPCCSRICSSAMIDVCALSLVARRGRSGAVQFGRRRHTCEHVEADHRDTGQREIARGLQHHAGRCPSTSAAVL